MNLLNRIRERINVRLFGHKTYVLRVLQVLSILISTLALGSIVYYYGFPKTAETNEIVSLIIRSSFIFYILKFFIKVFYDFHPLRFIRSNLFEAVIMLILIINGLSHRILGMPVIDLLIYKLGLFDIKPYSILFIQLYFFVIVGIELGKASQKLYLFHLGPASLLTASFIILILLGTLLLMLPEMTQGGIRFIDALFTSTSASCVTGLTVVDTGTFFTLKGKIVILLLIQLGGINIISFATFFATFYRGGGIRYQSLLKDLFSAGSLSDTRRILRDVFFYSLSFELAGAILIYFLWGDNIHFHHWTSQAFYSVFHSISAFNNAGFSLFQSSFWQESVRDSYGLHIVLIFLIFFGGIGFLALQDMFSLKRIKERRKFSWKRLNITTRIALNASFLLIVSGAVIFYLIEKDNTLQGKDIFGSVVTSVFQSVTCRTAGFNTVDFSSIGLPALIFMMFLMFIGASPGSTGGGIKTTTFAVILKSALATIRGKKNVEMFKHSISFSVIDRSYSIALFSLSLIFFSTFFLSITESGFPFLNLMFEEISAFGTVGLSTGITPYLSDAGKLIIVLTMFIGRIGTLTLALVLSRKVISSNYKYAEANLMIG